jgi:hypothetical protein
MVEPHELANLPADPHQLFGCVVEAEDMVERDGDASGPFDFSHYLANPRDYSP